MSPAPTCQRHGRGDGSGGGLGEDVLLTGKGGEHALAVGNGLISTALSRVGRNAGKALAEKRDKKEEKKAEGANGTGGQPQKGADAKDGASKSLPGSGSGASQEPEASGDFGDLVRDIFLTPDGESTEGRRGGRPERAKPSRFIRATVRN